MNCKSLNNDEFGSSIGNYDKSFAPIFELGVQADFFLPDKMRFSPLSDHTDSMWYDYS